VNSKLAHLIEQQITDVHATRDLCRQLPDGTKCLLPGRSPGRPRNPIGVTDTMRL
jgi:hypothetical protein